MLGTPGLLPVASGLRRVPPRAAQWPKRRLALGFGLLEVLVALVILAVGLLGIAGLLITEVKENGSAYLRQQAVQSAYDILDSMRANQVEAIAGAYNMCNLQGGGCPSGVSGGTVAAPSVQCAPTASSTTTVACTPAQMASYDVYRWASADLSQLPNGAGAVSTVASGSAVVVTVTVQWSNNPAPIPGVAATAGSYATYTLQTML